ncbi:ROK family transcriptional regulator [Nocardioides marmorisolisilvae]|uniref:ROK family transcriptional regulator n=1 Tax=Nocardioides marmorisolisilvae TaxID=1542737 RepID=UPI001C832736
MARRPGRTRAQLARDVGLTKATVSTLVDDLILSALVVEREPTAGLRGRPGSRLELNPDGAAAIGVEIDVDRTSACLLDLTGAVRDRKSIAYDNRSGTPRVALRRVAQLVADLSADTLVAGVGVAFPGLVTVDGRVLRAPNLPRWEGSNLGEILGDLLDVPVHSIDNEANIAALAEHWYGSGISDFVHVSGEIGVGGGIIVNGELFVGPRGYAGEIGHVPVDPRGPLCGCGNRGCLEQLAGRTAVLAHAQASSDAELVFRCDHGDREALLAVRSAAAALAVALGAVINTLDLPAVSLGGFYARLAPWLVEPLATGLKKRIVSGAPIDVRVSSLGQDAAALGAAGQVINHIVRTGERPASRRIRVS